MKPIVHRAGAMIDGVQCCVRCGISLTDERGRIDRWPEGFPEWSGDVTQLGEGHFTAGVKDGAEPCNFSEFVHNFRLPIFNPCNVWLILTDSVRESRKKRSDIFGPIDDMDFCGLFSFDERGKFAIFLTRGMTDHELIAHELFHATVRMLEYCEVGMPFKGGHETHAYVNGYLHEVVYGKLREWGEIK